jgi:hypothetical protein
MGLNPMILRQVRDFTLAVSPSEPPAVPRRGYRASGFVLGRIPDLQALDQERQDSAIRTIGLTLGRRDPSQIAGRIKIVPVGELDPCPIALLSREPDKEGLQRSGSLKPRGARRSARCVFGPTEIWRPYSNGLPSGQWRKSQWE